MFAISMTKGLRGVGGREGRCVFGRGKGGLGVEGSEATT